MKKLRLFFMMAFAVLFAGWAFAEDNDPVDVPLEEQGPQFDIFLTIGNGGDAATTGIYQNVYADWAADIEDATFFETPRTLTYTYQLMTDGSNRRNARPEGDPVVKTKQVFKDGTEVPVRSQFVPDKLVPNRLYKVMVSIPGDEDGEVHQSDWYYFISAIPTLVPGTLVWNWEPATTDEDGNEVYEYRPATDQAEVNGGNLKWRFNDFKKTISGDITGDVDGVRGYVELYVNGELDDSWDSSNNSMTNSEQMRTGRSYEVKAYATYTYKPGTIVERTLNDVPGVYVVRGANKSVSSAVVTRGPRTWGGSYINPLDIHVGERANGQTLVALDNLPADMPNTAMGALYYKTADMTTYEAVAANMWVSTRVAEFRVPVDEDFKFYIQIYGIVDGKLKLFEMKKKNEAGELITAGDETWAADLTYGDAKAFDLADKHLLWSNGEQGGFVMPLDKLVAGATYQMELTVAGSNRTYYVNGVDAADPETEEATVTFDFTTAYPTRPQLTLAKNTEFTSMSVTVGGEDYLNDLKQDWKFFTSEGARVVDALGQLLDLDNMNDLAYVRCNDLVFSGDVVAYDDRVDPAVPLMSVDDPTQPAPLYFYDWAWTPKTAPVIKDIQIEYNDEVTFITTNEARDEDTEVTMKSQIKYTLPTKYNNAQAIGELTVYDYIQSRYANALDETEYVNKSTGVVPTGEVVVISEENGYNADWGKKLIEKGFDKYGPYTLYTVVKGEIAAGDTKMDANCFTIAPREGKVNLGSEGVEGWDAVEDEPAPVYIETNTLVNGVLTLVPQFVVNNIYNWNRVVPEDETNPLLTGECGQCDFTIYAWLEDEAGNIAKDKDGVALFTETSATGTINELGEVVLNNKLLFVNVDYETTYKLKGYMLYTPQRYTLLGTKPTLTEGKEPEVGPVVKVPFEISITTGSEFPAETPETTNIKYYIAEKDHAGNAGHFVEARIYDPENKAGKVGVADNIQMLAKLISKTDYPAPVQGKWVPATETEQGYFSFIFPVDKDLTTTNVLTDYEYNFTYWYKSGEITTDAVVSDEPIDTPNPYLVFEKHYPGWDATYNDLVNGDDFTAEAVNAAMLEFGAMVGPWSDELPPFCAELKNFFAFTGGAVPTYFENWEDYYVIDEAKNLVFGYTLYKSALVQLLTTGASGPWGNAGGMFEEEEEEPAPARRIDKVASTDDEEEVEEEIVEEEIEVIEVIEVPTLSDILASIEGPVALVVRLSDTEYEDYKQSIYFNDVEFTALDAKYTATFKYQARTLIVPFTAAAPEGASVQCLQSGYLNEAASSAIFKFVQRKQNHEDYNYLTAARPYLIKLDASLIPTDHTNGAEFEFTGEEVVMKKSDYVEDGEVNVFAGTDVVMSCKMHGLYSYKYNSEIVPEDVTATEFYYRFSPKQWSFGELMKPRAEGAVDPSYPDTPYSPTFNAVKCFEAYLYILDKSAEGNVGWSISFRFDGDDDDATMIENVNVVTESSELFDLMGRKVIDPVKGQIYIQNGKKILF